MSKIANSIFFIIVILVGSLFVYLVIDAMFSPVILHKTEDIIWGVDFSQSQAEYLQLDWRETYAALVHDLGVRNIKLHTNWSWVEGERNDYYFEDIDWQVKEAERNNIKMIYVVGVKTGRWPECHPPSWIEYLSKDEQQAEALEYITHVVSRYKDSNAIQYWQVENEPFLRFGECPWWYYEKSDFLRKEIELVKSLDPSRKIVVSDSGELSSWGRVADHGDVVGITLYRNAWSPGVSTFGINPYSFLTPEVYANKAATIRETFGKEVICIELQAEPWASQPLMEASLEEQLQIMDLATFKENVEFARQTNLDAFYFWGAEWWYWLKTKQQHPEIWNEAKKIFSS